MYKNGINQYRQVGIKDQLATADPHRVTQILMQTALENLATAKGFLERGDISSKGKPLAKATTIITSLRDTLDFEKGGDIASNLNDLYVFILARLSEASITNDAAIVTEVIELMLPIKSAWDQIPESAKEEAYAQR
ncbi:flagellar export chaperone FliS [Alginatibacterium sediminis]|uniref:Flagellar secretion chaperone FliS n=1 Tax=Alginatibacterium sediminis TaxID=2164068 RepID=A0A420EG25_9ALTE|nr:flagellar export chaperone FliS [Alginatibacterium sediminis]RKF19637.1 flagellar export chaperone FliS [Alginatibacterium sediminis]